MNFKPLTPEEAVKISGYIYIKTELRVDENNYEYVNNDFFYTELCRTSKPLYLDNSKLMPYYMLLHLGGGFKPTEYFRSDLIVGDNSKAIFSSQSATKVFKDDQNLGPAIYDVNLYVGSNSYVEYINDSVILYKDARFKQQNKFYLKKDSSFFYSEIFSPGYSPDLTKYAYNLMHLNTEIYLDDKLLVYDNLVFEPKKEMPSKFGIMDNYDRCGTIYFISNLINQNHVDEIRKIVNSEFKNIDFKWGSSLEKNLLSIRILANQTFEINEISMRINDFIRYNLFGMQKLNLRKQ